jgi:hypothetical protein
MAKSPVALFLPSNAGCHREAPQADASMANYVNPVKAENVVPIHKRVSVRFS